MKCDRCHKETNATMMSRFNKDTLCMDRIEREKQHPMYAEACRVELEHVKAGDYNFEGIGKPDDL